MKSSNLDQTAVPSFWPQRSGEIYLPFLEMPQNGTCGTFSNAKVSRTLLHSKHFYTHTILVKRVYDNNYCHPYFKGTPKYKIVT